MHLSLKLDQHHTISKQNKWLQYLINFNHIALTAGFLPASIIKIKKEI